MLQVKCLLCVCLIGAALGVGCGNNGGQEVTTANVTAEEAQNAAIQKSIQNPDVRETPTPASNER